MARATFLIKLLVLCMLVPGALCNKNLNLNGSPCDNTVNGNTTSSTDVDGNIIVGCGNTVSNITSDGATAVTVDITGSDNVAEDDVIRNGDGEFTIVGNRNEVLNDEADYIDLYKSNNNLIENNIATDSAIEFDYANGNTLLNNVADYFDLYNSSNNLIENNTATDDGIEFDHANGNTLLNNVADYMGLYDANNNKIENNVVGDYISLSHSNNNTIKDNIISSDIDFDYANGNTLLNNVADYVYLYNSSSNLVESNQADYGIYTSQVFNTTVTGNSFGRLQMTTDTSGVVESNTVDSSADIAEASNFSITKNIVNEIDIADLDDFSESGNVQSGSTKLTISNVGVTSTSITPEPPFSVRYIRFPGAGVISGITHNIATVHPSRYRSTAVSAFQAVALQKDTAAVAKSLTTANATLLAHITTLTAGLAAANATLLAHITTLTAGLAAATAAATASNTVIAALALQVDTLKTGFCPPAASGRHLLAELTPIVPPASCNKATPVTTATDIVTTTLSLSGVNLATFSSASVATALANHASVHATDITVSITDFPITTTVSFAGAGLTSLTAAQVTGITAAIDAKLPATAMVPALGSVTPAGRRLLDLSVPVTVTAVGSDPILAAQAQAAITNAATLGAAATAAGVPSTAVSATPATVSAVMTISVRAASAASAASIASALSPANSAAISSQLAAAGVSHTGITVTTPVLSKPLAPASSSTSGQNKEDLFALLVLLIVPIGGIGYVAGKYLERKRAVDAQAESKAHAVDTITVVETA